MRAPIIRLLLAAASVCVGGLVGCSALKLGYGQAAPFTFRWLDGYVDFNDAQELRVRGALADWFAWHRRTQLPDYADLLARARVDVLLNTTPERACLWWREAKSRAEPALEHALPTIAEVLATLQPAQIARIEKRYADSNSEFRDEYLEPDLQTRRRKSIERAVDRAESIYGRLDGAQREGVARSVGESPFDADLWYQERQRRQQDALQMIRRLVATHPPRADAEAQVRAYLERVDRSPRDVYRRYSDKLEAFNCASASTLQNATTSAQRQSAAMRLRGWEEDVRSLAADG